MLLPMYPVLAFFLREDVAQGTAWSALITLAVCMMAPAGLGPWSGPLAAASFDGFGMIAAVMIMVSLTMAVYLSSQRRVLGRLERLCGELAEESLRDPLTDLNNRRMLGDYLARYLGRAARGPEGLAVALLDIDHFNAFNDAHGHPAGDAAMQDLAGALDGVFSRGDDVLIRVGGEEFCVLCFYRDREAVTRMFEGADEAVAALGYPSPGGPMARMTGSIGLVLVEPGEHCDDDSAYRRADETLYRAKAP